MKKWLTAIAVLFAAAASASVIAFGSHAIFTRRAAEYLSGVAYTKNLELDTRMAPELTLSLQMVRSPVVRAYMLHPEIEENRQRAFEEFKVYQDEFASKRIFWISDNELVYYVNMEGLYTLDPQDADNAWYELTLGLNKEYDFFVDYEKAMNKTFLWVNALVQGEGTRPAGIAGTGIELSDFVDYMYSQLDPGLTMYMYNDREEVSGSLNRDHLESKAKIASVLPELNRAKTLFPEQNELLSTWKGAYLISPLQQVGWTMVLFEPYTFRQFITNAMMPVAAILVIVIILILISTVRNLFKPLKDIEGAVKNIASGDADLTQRLNTDIRTSFKVIPSIVEGFNGFIEKLQHSMQDLRSAEQNLNSVSGAVQESAEATASSISDITSTIGSVQSQVDDQSKSVKETSQVMNDFASGIGNLASMINSQSASISDASSAIEQLVGNISSIRASMEKMTNSFGILDSEAQNGVSKQERVNERIRQIESQSKMLQDANTAIATIAEQTNLLAMNAAIEAAHAGEAGKGFAVVADEIRKLSETSSAQSRTIGDELNNIQGSIDEIVISSQESSEAFETVSSKIRETDGHVREVHAALEEQNEGSAHVISLLHSMQDITGNVKDSSDKMADETSRVMEEMERLKASVKSVEESMSSIFNGARIIDRNGQTLSETFGGMQKSISEITGAVGQFKV